MEYVIPRNIGRVHVQGRDLRRKFTRIVETRSKITQKSQFYTEWLLVQRFPTDLRVINDC